MNSFVQPIQTIKSRRGGSGVEWSGDACVALGGVNVPKSMSLFFGLTYDEVQFPHRGRRKRPCTYATIAPPSAPSSHLKSSSLAR
jgi:hypothetical protein